MLIDTHAHLNFKDFEDDLDEVIERARNNGVKKIILIACEKESYLKAKVISSRFSNIFFSVGVHPYDADKVDQSLMDFFSDEIKENNRIVAVGECGLDYFKAKAAKAIQKNAFLMQLELARKHRLPVIIHNRDADVDTLQILDEFNKNGEFLNAVFHCFGGNLDFARQLWDRGYFTSFTGIVTYPNATELHKVVTEVPMDKFMVETDCPFLSPQKFRGKRNEPAYVPEIAHAIAELKGISFIEVADKTTENAMKFFQLNQ